MECTWVDTLDGAQDDGPLPEGADHYELQKYHDFNGITSPFGAHFVLKIEKILMKEKYADAIINGVRPGDFPPLPGRLRLPRLKELLVPQSQAYAG